MSNPLLPQLRQTVAWLAARAWPQSCALCGENAENAQLCAACVVDLPGQGLCRCVQCALPIAAGTRCGACLKRPPQFDETRALYAYQGVMRNLVLQVKGGNSLALTEWFAQRLAHCAADFEADIIVPMPLHPQRLAERGLNPAVELARGVARDKRLAIAYSLVVRDANTPHQAGLRRRERQRNVRGVFRVTQRLENARVLVVDDVMTSGSTLNELARTLKLAGASQVSNVVLARTAAQIKK